MRIDLDTPPRRFQSGPSWFLFLTLVCTSGCPFAVVPSSFCFARSLSQRDVTSALTFFFQFYLIFLPSPIPLSHVAVLTIFPTFVSPPGCRLLLCPLNLVLFFFFFFSDVIARLCSLFLFLFFSFLLGFFQFPHSMTKSVRPKCHQFPFPLFLHALFFALLVLYRMRTLAITAKRERGKGWEHV